MSQADIGPTHNIFLSPYEDFRPGSDQYDWFYNDLISIDRTLTPWVTLNIHNPWCAGLAPHRGVCMLGPRLTLCFPIIQGSGFRVLKLGFRVDTVGPAACPSPWHALPCHTL